MRKVKLPDHVEYNGHSFKLADWYVNSEEFKQKLLKMSFTVHNDFNGPCECESCEKYRRDHKT